jgi:hypothetical protein
MRIAPNESFVWLSTGYSHSDGMAEIDNGATTRWRTLSSPVFQRRSAFARLVQPNVGDTSEPVLAELAGSSNVLVNYRKSRTWKTFTQYQVKGTDCFLRLLLAAMFGRAVLFKKRALCIHQAHM